MSPLSVALNKMSSATGGFLFLLLLSLPLRHCSVSDTVGISIPQAEMLPVLHYVILAECIYYLLNSCRCHPNHQFYSTVMRINYFINCSLGFFFFFSLVYMPVSCVDSLPTTYCFSFTNSKVFSMSCYSILFEFLPVAFFWKGFCP